MPLKKLKREKILLPKAAYNGLELGQSTSIQTALHDKYIKSGVINDVETCIQRYHMEQSLGFQF